MAAVTELATAVGTRAACLALWVPRGSYYRDRRSAPSRIRTAPRPSSVRALAAAERETILAYLHHERFQDRSPAAVYATLLDEGQYHCSIRTMYRLLAAKGESRERRDQLTHPSYQKPELLATAPNQLWSWDSPQELLSGDDSQAAPDWSPDGTSVVFGGFPEEISGDSSATSIHLLDLKTHQTSTLPGSEGLYCPRWSPDGRYISATSADGRKLMLFDGTNRKWTEPEDLPEGCPAWSHDGKYLYFQSFDVKEPAFFRMRISDRRRERLAEINLRRDQFDWFWWNGLAPGDSPLVLRDESSEEIYALDWLLP